VHVRSYGLFEELYPEDPRTYSNPDGPTQHYIHVRAALV
jgi:hypothetical protein